MKRSQMRSIRTAVGRSLCVLAAAAAMAAAGMVPATAMAAAGLQPLRELKLADLKREPASEAVRHIADWAVATGDPGGLPFVIVDKVDSRVYVFDASGHLRGASAALVGAARGDTTVPDIGSRPISQIRPEERTTPAGRFLAVMGRGPQGEDILWVDYDSALALHRVVTNVAKERRLERLQSQRAADRRITYGCINVPVPFYESVVRPAFSAQRGVVYILPESRPPQELFGSYDVRTREPAPPTMTATSAH